MNDSPRPTDVVTKPRSGLDDWRGLGDLVTLAAVRIAAPVEGTHRAIADRWFGLAGPHAESAHRAYDRLIASSYETIRVGGSALGAGIDFGARVASRRWSLRPLWGGPRGSHVQSIFNAVWGDRFDDDKSSFRIELGIRDASGAPIRLDPGSLGRAFPRPQGRLVVLLHGLGETEQCWVAKDKPHLADLLESDGFSVLLVRYNTGRSISANGLDLADLLEEAMRMWPVPVTELALVGHSMGGLIARSAVATAQITGHSWVGMTNHLVAVGSPHLGTPIEKTVHLVNEGLDRFKESRPLGTFIGERSAGIKDLRHGPSGIEDQMGRVEHHFVAGSITNNPAHPLAALVGDLIVRVNSATGQGRRRKVPASDTLVLGGRHHAALIHDDDVHSRIRGWLTAGPA